MNSLDPRVNRLPKIDVPAQIEIKSHDQFGTFEVFVQPKKDKPFQHEGIVHAPNLEMAYVLAKETFTRRFLCSSLCVVDTRNVHVSPMTEGNADAYDTIPNAVEAGENGTTFEIYHLLKRGKQYVHAGTISAATPEQAMSRAKKMFKPEKTVYNIWAIDAANIRFTAADEKDLWLTLPDKKFRDASDYKGSDKLKAFLERSK